jgi:hypothetical protein
LDDAVRHGHIDVQVEHTILQSNFIDFLSHLWKALLIYLSLQRMLRKNGASLDVASSALKMCDAAARLQILLCAIHAGPSPSSFTS